MLQTYVKVQDHNKQTILKQSLNPESFNLNNPILLTTKAGSMSQYDEGLDIVENGIDLSGAMYANSQSTPPPNSQRVGRGPIVALIHAAALRVPQLLKRTPRLDVMESSSGWRNASGTGA